MEGRHWRWQKQQQQQQQHQQSYFQNPNFTFQNPNPNPNVYYHSHAFASPNLPHQQWQHRPSFRAGYQAQAQAQNPSFFPPNPSYAPSPPAPPPPPPQARKKTVEEVDKAATNACAELQAAGENVSAWKVSQAALMALEIESWISLGFQMQQVPSLNNLIAVEGKINAFIHCFVVVQRITSLYDLEVEICKNEGVGKFEELGLGPLVKHPLVMHYFSLPSDVTEIIKITTAEIVLLLHTFLRFNHAKKIEVEEFLDFVANRRKVANRLKLGIHIRNFGTLVSVIKKANKLEDVVLGKHKEVVQPEKKKRNKRPLFSSLKKELDERFDSISQRVESFSSVEKRFRGKHIKFMSSSSEDEPSDDSSYEDDSDDVEDRISPQAANTADRASGCPYPSATEEMTRLGLKSDTKVHPSSASGSQKHPKTSGAVKRKRNPEESGTNSLPIPSKLRKINNEGLDILSAKDANRTKEDSSMVKDDLTSTKRDEFFLTNDSLRLFVAIWKERCQGVCVGKVLKRMLRFYKIRDRKTMNHMYTSYPFIGILNVAVSSIKLGIWDSIYDTVQGISQNDLSKPLISDACEYENINVEPSTKDAPVFTGHMADYAIAVSVEDIITKVAAYLKHDHEGFKNDKSLLKSRFSILRNLFNCENWLAEQFRVKEFRALGYGDFLLFMEKHASLLPQELCGFLIGDSIEKSPLEVHMMHQQLVILLSQASNNIWENKRITEQDIFSLLTRQFPFITFKVVANGSLKDFLSAAVKDKSFITPKSVIFFSTLCTTTNKSESSSSNKKGLLESFPVRYDKDQDIQTHGFFTHKDAIEVLLKAPMLSDLNLWSHWDLRFAPTLGPLVPWLLKEVKTDELLCLVTRDGKVVRIDPSATADSFLEAAVQGSSFQTAVQLLSLFSVVGGQEQVSVSLLKCHAHHAFKVISKNSLEDAELNGCESSFFNRKVLCGDRMTGERATSKFSCELQNDFRKMNVSVSSVARFILDCLLYLPSEIRAFSADIFLSGMQAIVKDGASAILCECSQTDQRLMLHEVGLSLGVVEWINDYHAFCSKDANDLVISEASCKPKHKHKHKQDVLEEFSCTEGSADVSVSEDKQIRKCTQVSAVMSNSEVSGDKVSSGGSLSGPHGQKDAALVIESIRRDEFGLDPSLSNVESGMLKKQHARLGRALHCLSQELYSQDSHFILELVQNADDNTYSDYVEPTLTFILQDSGIIVLNNEHGFTAQNIRALCDIGSSTKKGSNAGYIGKKGIGFKSVFRITDAPEIHSNGFHVKFDISEGQIGFVLPTVIPPCDLNLFSRLASSGFDQLGFNNWNTCIVLPFRSRQSEGTAMRSIISMFSDLHPSLLLFLHRLQCIKFRNMLEDSVMVMRKEIVGDGIINVSYGKEKMTWLVVSQKLRSNFIRSDVPMTEISMAFTLQESADGGYSPLLSQQPVFSFLPLRTYGLKFILQGNFDLPSSREEVDGSSSWNQWLLSEYPGLFVEAERSFCALPCFKDTPGKAVAAFMSFVPLVGEVHGFFSSLPRMIISKLRMSKCLLLEGGNREWVPPCKVLRGWSEQAQSILPHSLLHEHLGLGFLDKDVVLSDALAKALGVEEYGPKVIVQLMASLCVKESGLKSMGFGWLSSCLTELCSMLEHFPGRTVLDSEMELEIMNNLKRIPFIPLSNGTFSSVNEGTIWIQSDASSSVSDGEHKIESFPSLYAKLRIVSPVLLSVSSIDGSCNDLTISDKLAAVLYKIGVQRLSAHEIIRVHILPSLSDVTADKDKNLMIEYVCFVISHLNSSCHDCHVEREYIMSELQNKAYILTNNGFKRPAEVSVHFSTEFGNPVNTTKLIDSLDMGWHEVDSSYLKHPITKSLPSGLSKLRELFQGIGVTDFVKVIEVEKTVADISHAQFKNFIPDGDSFSLGSIVRDWESPELVMLLSLLSRDGNKKSCEYLLEILDKLWDSCFSDKTTAYCTSESVVGSKPFKSSFISSISDVQWVVSTMDNKLHYPRDLFYDCDVVRSVLGASAPYAVPKVKNEKLVTDIGFKTKVTIEDIIAMLKLWSCENPFMASISQMSKLYTFIWKEVATSAKLAEEFHSGSFIFVPYTSGSRHEDVVSGMFLSPREVYWSDSTGAMDQMSKMHPQHSLKDVALGPLNKTLCNIYPGLHNFFVNACGVHENPSLSAYLQILLQLSSVALPSQAAKAVFQILLKWTDGLKSGSDDFVFIKESLKKVEFTVLPTKQDKWVSLHPSFGITCWCDDKKLKKHFKHMDGIDFFYFGKLNKDEKEMFRTKVSVLMRTLGIPALSEVVSREALYYGVSDSSFKASLVNWALPYAQRYLHALHPDKYSQLKQSGFDSLKCLQVVVVEQLFYRNVIKSCGSKSEKQVECTCVLEDNVLYTTQESDAHALFLELSRLFFQGNPELQMANFLHMITTMAESGSSEDQTEFFILNSQKIPKLPDGESVWSLPPVSSLEETAASKTVKNRSSSKSKQKASSTSNWPPVDWKTAPGFSYACAHGFRTQSLVAQPGHDSHQKTEDDYENVDEICDATQISIGGDWTIEDDSGAASTTLALPDTSILENQWGTANDEAEPEMSREFNPNGLHSTANMFRSGGRSQHYKSDQIRIGAPNQQGILTGRVGEHLAFKYFTEKAGTSTVKWVNKNKETGLPYDLVIKDKNSGNEYIEVKATVSPRKNWLMITMKEWQFANEKGDAFSIAHVVLLKNNFARVTVFKNPVKLLEQRKLRLVVVMPTDQEYSVVS